MDGAQTEQITREKYASLEDELAELRERQKEIVEAIAEARALGDLSENAEYHSAKEEQEANDNRISELSRRLANARIVDPSEISTMSISVGNAVEVEDDKGARIVYEVVSSMNANPIERKVSTESPLGKALIGHVRGDEISFFTPSGRIRRLTIVDITVA